MREEAEPLADAHRLLALQLVRLVDVEPRVHAEDGAQRRLVPHERAVRVLVVAAQLAERVRVLQRLRRQRGDQRLAEAPERDRDGLVAAASSMVAGRPFPSVMRGASPLALYPPKVADGG